MKLTPLAMENKARVFVNKLKEIYPNAHWEWTGAYNNEDGYIVIWDESDIENGQEWMRPKYKMLDGGTIVPIEP